MMYKVMVVDDETLGRKSIRKMISELSLDVEVIAEAQNGEEALELIEISKPHIVVTDMNMPVMDGQRFLEALHDRFGDIRVIVISGYSQFEYLKAAIRYQACEYLLKPVSVPELRESMVQAIEAIRRYMSLQQQQRETREMRRMKRGAFLINVTVQRITNRADILQQARELQMDAGIRYRLVLIRFRQFSEVARTNFHGNAELLMFSIDNILREILGDDQIPAFISEDGMGYCLIVPASSIEGQAFAASEAGGDSVRFEWLEALHEAVQRTLRLEVLAGVSGLCEGFAELPEAYRTAERTLLRLTLHGSGLTVSLADNPEQPRKTEALPSFVAQEIRQAFASGNAKDLRRLLDEYQARVDRSVDITISQVHRELAIIREAAVSEMRGIAAAHPPLYDAAAITEVTDPAELRRLLTGWADAAEEYGADRRETDSSQLIWHIVDYLDAHYFEDISLIDVATRFHLDPSYLSKLFKSVTSENFIEYVTRKRIEKACELLRSSERKISEISELIGYENQRYFSQVFKKSTGQTPSEYREAQQSGEAGNPKN
ncbi:response regulator [Paenibacillus phoenicis]|uniref:Response regulator n=1 Tax=Paenibacillus phoenicis TaxID=554117 RepID=A0ABU5PQD4_9BACL|nr:response regulator [Paenibacillus phoenicis]MEA3572160.1 response regulator [Paenibacillus phoenicis]